MDLNIEWFKENISIYLTNKYRLEYFYFENGDLGDLNRVEFENNEKCGNIDFWSSGWLGLHLIDYNTQNELLNLLLEPQENKEKEKAISCLLLYLK